MRANVLVLTAIAAALIPGGIAAASEVAEEPDVEAYCRASLQPEAVLTEDGESSVTVEFSRDPGPVAEIRAEEGSGVFVIGFEVPEESLSGDLLAHLDLSDALPGSWSLEFEGDSATCRAEITVADSAAARVD